MSFILDALKKAEQERARGLPPGLHSQVPVAPNRRLGVLLALFLAAGAGVVWSVFFRETESETRTTAKQTPPAVANGATANAQASRPTEIVSSQPVQAELPNAAPLPADMDKVTTVSAHQAPVPVPTLATPITGASSPQFAQSAPAQLPTVEPPQTAVPIADQSATVVSPPDPAAVIQPTAEPPIPAVAQVPTPEPGNPAASVPAAPSLPQMFELEYSVRHELPKMLLSMHVYNRDPQRRFVVINGKRLVEGEQIEGKVTIAAIVPTGIECEMNGTRFLFPRQTL